MRKKTVHTMIKYISIISLAVILVFLFAPKGSAQIEYIDPGIPDTVAIVLDIDTIHMQATVELYVFNDDTLIGVSPGFHWDNENFQMDSVVIENIVQFGFDIGPYTYEDNDIFITNQHQTFLIGGVANFGDRIPPTGSRRLWVTYYFTITSWDGLANDGITIDTMRFNNGSTYLFVAAGQMTFHPVWAGKQVFGNPLAVEQEETPLVPKTFGLYQNYPNPFNPTTEIQFDIPSRSWVTVQVYNILGQQVAVLVDEELSAGRYHTTWDGMADNGAEVASGLYFYKIRTDAFTQTKKMMLIK